MTANVPAIIPVAEIERMAALVAKSGLFGVKTMEQAAALMLIAHAEGLHPAVAARDYHVIQGRPSLKADAMLARFQATGGKVEWTCHTDAKVAAKFTHPSGGTLEIDWTIERAKTAGLAGRDQWKAYPRQMLRARVISEGVRAVAPGVVSGVYTPEEVADMEPERKPEAARDVTPARPQLEQFEDAPAPKPAPAKLRDAAGSPARAIYNAIRAAATVKAINDVTTLNATILEQIKAASVFDYEKIMDLAARRETDLAEAETAGAGA